MAHLTDALVALGPRRHAFRERRRADDGAPRADAQAGVPARRAAAQVRRRRPSRDAVRRPPTRARFRRAALPPRSPAFPVVRADREPHAHDAARPPRHRRPAGVVSALAGISADLDLRQPAAAASARELARDRPSRRPAAPLFDFAPAHRGYLAFVGRISPEKRPDRAIEIARAAGVPLQASPRRSTPRTRRISASHRTDVATAPRRVPGRGRRFRARTSSWAARRRCSSRSTGPSRSGSS